MVKKNGAAVMRVLVTILGVTLILWGISTFALGIVGEKDTAVITDVRRQGGERTDGKPGRYTYSISYSFILPDGKKINGSTTKISNGAYLKKPNTITAVRYLGAMPVINALESETRPNLGQLTMVVAGGFLIYSMNKRNRKYKWEVKSIFTRSGGDF